MIKGAKLKSSGRFLITVCCRPFAIEPSNRFSSAKSNRLHPLVEASSFRWGTGRAYVCHRPFPVAELAHSVLSRHLYIEPLSLGLPKLMQVPEVANHLVCSVCGAKNSDTYHPIWVRPDARVPGVTGQYPDFNKR